MQGLTRRLARTFLCWFYKYVEFRVRRGSSVTATKKSKKKGSKKKKKSASAAVSAPVVDDVANALALELEAASVGPQAANSLDFLIVDLKFLNSSSEWRRLFGSAGVRSTSCGYVLSAINCSHSQEPEPAAAEEPKKRGSRSRQGGAAALKR